MSSQAEPGTQLLSCRRSYRHKTAVARRAWLIHTTHKDKHRTWPRSGTCGVGVVCGEDTCMDTHTPCRQC